MSREMAAIPAAPTEALADNDWWHGIRCICGLPAFRSVADRRALVHPWWQPAAGAYLNSHPHNVQVADQRET